MEQVHAEHSHSQGWLDKIAVSMAMVCGVHCLLTPILVALLPVLSTSFFVHEDFHLWMLFFVIPTTGLAVFMGCRKHKDRLVAVLSGAGMAVLIAAFILGMQFHGGEASCAELCASGHHHAHAGFWSHSKVAWFNTLGGLLIAAAHVRNYRLCRKGRCQH
ncbi:MerC domain-containing protein [Coraliomargarita akajimensis]|uniref:MerC mercury resistance protein n=1 Tax=Coraliomargarita akajimensis (strain DSM 45221 / IAM 15411 / JCM 23193 / KCTC 12865 / 04OKA010-24) TaxID=583355 RepID=D5ELB5_CORAD|nr:MerC domain-containing protein [Coraliomargarita akajimensis]ADE55051.1 hypothetical protein Caka_2033 [Coraliomargarita akajimensis DSM 45221]